MIDLTAATPVTERRFRVMGTSAHVVLVGAAARLADTAEQRLADLEAKWSRFRPDSELSRLNAAPDRPVVVSPETYTVIDLAVRAWRETGGRFDPTVLDALVALGYDRSFEHLTDDAAPLPPAPPVPGCGGVRLLAAVPAVIVPSGCRLDLGGIGKGHAADLVVAEMMAAGAVGACVNIGGDLRVAGEPPDGAAGWSVGVEHPDDPGSDLVRLTLTAGAVATSTNRRRRWRRAGHEQHHLVDPGRGRPAATGVAAVTVVAGEAWRAEVLAKACFLAPADAAGLLAPAAAAALVRTDAGDSRLLNGMEAFCQ